MHNSQISRPLDTIPPEVKQYFFKDRQPPNLLKDYDILGFDADHCIVKYNVKPLTQLLITEELQDFYEMGYPEQIRKAIDFSDESYEICMNGAIYDIDNGLIIRLVEGQEVTRAMRGFRALTKEEIVKVYGNPPIFRHYQWPNTTHLSGKKGAYWAFITFFDVPKIAIVLSAIDLIDRGILKNKNYYDIAEDIRQIVYKNYIHFNDKEVKRIGTYGKFFPEMLKNPLKYIQFQPSLRESLQTLRNNGKKLFLATNSHTEYSNLIMTTTLGDDWRSFFDIVCCYCRKPLFFWDQKIDPFYVLDETKANYKGKAIVDPEELKEGQIYTQGNSKTLTGFFQKLLQKKDVKFAFFGDQYITDVYSSSIQQNWDAFAVVEEMTFYDDRYCEGVDPQLMRYDKYWGDNYFIEVSEDGQTYKRNYFIAQVEDCARYMLPLMRNINLMMIDQQ